MWGMGENQPLVQTMSEREFVDDGEEDDDEEDNEEDNGADDPLEGESEDEDNEDNDEDEATEAETTKRKANVLDVFGTQHAAALAHRQGDGNFEVVDVDETPLKGRYAFAKNMYVVIPKNNDLKSKKKRERARKNFQSRFGRRFSLIGFESPAKHGLGIPLYIRKKQHDDGSNNLMDLVTLEDFDPEEAKREASEQFDNPFESIVW